MHFDDDQWEKTRQDGTRKLKSNAVPTLFQNAKSKARRQKFTDDTSTTLKSFEANDQSCLFAEYDYRSPRYDRNASHNNAFAFAFRAKPQRGGGDTRCRLCATRNGSNYTWIFGESDLAEKISRCLPIVVNISFRIYDLFDIHFVFLFTGFTQRRIAALRLPEVFKRPEYQLPTDRRVFEGRLDPQIGVSRFDPQ